MYRDKIVADSEETLNRKLAAYLERYPSNPYGTVVTWTGYYPAENAWIAMIERGGAN